MGRGNVWIIVSLLVIGGAVGYHFYKKSRNSQEGHLPHLTTQEEFNTQVLGAEGPVLVDFYADWCPPCRQLAPILEDLSGTYAGRLAFIKIDVDKAPLLANQFKVRTIPAVFIFYKGKVVRKWDNRSAVQSYIDEALRQIDATQKTGQVVPATQPAKQTKPTSAQPKPAGA